ncbi:MAG: S8 family serine peptidase [Eubacteriales bacterium]|nr:S8 family serine peptidase [Eubacteriales bacterium]
MRFKAWASYVLVILMILAILPIPAVSAASDPLQVYADMGKSDAAFVPDEIVVKFKNDHKPFQVIKVPEGKVKAKVQEYARRPDVVYAEPNYYAQAFAAPNDFYYALQWNFAASSAGGINLEEAWTKTTGSGVTVAIVDTGIAYEDYGSFVQAPDLAATNFISGYDFVNNDDHANDDNSHGTHVAGTIAQSTNNSIGVAGIAYDATLMPVKVLNKKGSGTYTAIANGIRYAADHDADVINLSLGGPYPSTTLESALAYAHSKNVTIVAAAGNDGTGTVSYPAAYDAYVIAVGATRVDKTLAYYSNWGSSLDLVAPGGDVNVDQNSDDQKDGILQNTFNPTTKVVSDFGYYFFQGTSMASPHVAGVAALVIAAGVATSPADVQKVLQTTALDLGAEGRDNTYGHGLIDAGKALNATIEPTPPPTNTAPTADSQTVTTTVNTPVTITLTGSDPEGDSLAYVIVTEPAHGILSGTEPALTYTPNAEFAGDDSFTFKVSDDKLFSNPATVSITVNPATPPPENPELTVSIAMAISEKKAGKNYFAWATATVTAMLDTSPLAGATVTGHWIDATTDLDTGITGTNGSVSLTSDQVKLISSTSTLTFTFVVDQITKDGVTYTLAGETTNSAIYP